MATSLSVSVDIDKDVDTVFHAITDGDYIKQKLETNGARNINVKSSGANGTSANLVYTREEPADVPSALKKFISEWNELTNTDNWSGTAGDSYSCNYEVDMGGGPIKVGGTHTLEPNGSGGTTSTINMDISCGVPLLGKKIEQFVAGLSKKGLQDDVDFQKSFLDG